MDLAFEPAAKSAHGRIGCIGCILARSFERIAKGIEHVPAALAARVER